MRFWLITTAATVAVAMIVLYVPLRSFRRDRPVLGGEIDMLAFKRMASFQMYVSSFSTRLIGAPFLIGSIGKFALGQLTRGDGLWFVVIPFLVQGLLSAAALGTAREVRNTPTAGAAPAAERDRVVDVWVHKKFPEW